MATHSSRLCERLDSVKGLSNDELSRQLSQLAKQKHALDAELLLYLSEVDRRGLYREHAFSSLFEFCMCRLGCSEDVAYKRVGVARMLRQFPMVFDLLAEGRIHMSALMLVRPHLTDENCREWLLAAAGKSKRQVEMLVARRCPRPDVSAQVRKLPEPRPNGVNAITAPMNTTDWEDPEAEILPGPSDATIECPQVGQTDVRQRNASAPSPAAVLADSTLPYATLPSASALVGTAISSVGAAEPKSAVQHSAARSTRIQPLSGSSYRVIFTASEVLKQKLDHARELLSHAVSPSDLPTLIDRAIDLLIEHEERRRFATGSRRKTTAKHQPCQICQPNLDGSQDPGRVDGVDRCSTNPKSREDANPQNGPRRHEQANPQNGPMLHEDANLQDGFRARKVSRPRRSRYVPAEVRRAVWQRDEGQCTFVDAEGNRCNERRFLEMDHRFPYAIGGASTIENCRLMCRCHNSLNAELVFGCRKVEEAVAQVRARTAASP